MKDELKYIDIKQILKYSSVHEGFNLGEDFFVKDVKSGQNLGFLNYPFRADAYFAVFCKDGGVDVEINLKKYSLRKNMLLISLPGNIIKVDDQLTEDSSHGFFQVFAVSKSFIFNMKLDVTKVFDDHLHILADPCFKLTDQEEGFFNKYMLLIREIYASDIIWKEEAIGSLLSSMLYLMGGLVDKNAKWNPEQKPVSSSQLRLNLLFEDFMKLVAQYHTSERGVAFYANRLGLTPKYLSKLIKQVSGKSAPEWIDDFVILEAKNMLRYSGDSIKEIVYKLHFPNPSVFYKYFKAHTGMTPSEFRG
ncbi:MAG: AraC family transcriptional regulator [Bacteroidales bacterium]|nr:AraC family transcriptional regulator [Bacteroidales bacterium]